MAASFGQASGIRTKSSVEATPASNHRLWRAGDLALPHAEKSTSSEGALIGEKLTEYVPFSPS